MNVQECLAQIECLVSLACSLPRSTFLTLPPGTTQCVCAVWGEVATLWRKNILRSTFLSSQCPQGQL